MDVRTLDERRDKPSRKVLLSSSCLNCNIFLCHLVFRSFLDRGVPSVSKNFTPDSQYSEGKSLSQTKGKEVPSTKEKSRLVFLGQSEAACRRTVGCVRHECSWIIQRSREACLSSLPSAQTAGYPAGLRDSTQLSLLHTHVCIPLHVCGVYVAPIYTYTYAGYSSVACAVDRLCLEKKLKSLQLLWMAVTRVISEHCYIQWSFLEKTFRLPDTPRLTSLPGHELRLSSPFLSFSP